MQESYLMHVIVVIERPNLLESREIWLTCVNKTVKTPSITFISPLNTVAAAVASVAQLWFEFKLKQEKPKKSIRLKVKWLQEEKKLLLQLLECVGGFQASPGFESFKSISDFCHLFSTLSLSLSHTHTHKHILSLSCQPFLLLNHASTSFSLVSG